ncbi:MAG TPA: dephospho-CoA kinase [Thermoanaerobaculia bacterium]|nr:dephospho-CoA kinase [Thermoanaerobaculia bacterium]
MILKVGLTGGIASGKSTAREILGTLGCHVIDADKLVAELYEPDRAGHAALVATYGSQILRDDRTIDRVKLANIAFSSSDEAKKLNALIHPIVVQYTNELLDEYERTHGDQIVVVEATLLIEAAGRRRYDKIVVVDVAPETQIARGVARGLTAEEVTRRILNQLPRDERLRNADYVIDNNGDREQLEREVRRVLEALQRDLATKIAR